MPSAAQTGISQAAVQPVDSAANAIDIFDLRRSFGSQQVLAGVTAHFARGLITTIIGPSGCGKTVLLKHLNLLLRPDSGRILIEGLDVTRLGSRRLDAVRARFGMLFQGGALFDSLTVFENVAFPLVEKSRLTRSEIAPRVHAMLAEVGLDGMEDKYPSELSGGMQRRAALARALIGRPGILMLDEPTTGLDPTRIGSIHELIRRTQQQHQLTVVLVSHDVPHVFGISDRVALMHQGRIRCFGTAAELSAARDEVFEAFVAGRGAEERKVAVVVR